MYGLFYIFYIFVLNLSLLFSLFPQFYSGFFQKRAVEFSELRKVSMLRNIIFRVASTFIQARSNSTNHNRFNSSLPSSSLYLERQRRCSIQKGVLKNFVKPTWNHHCRSLFSNKIPKSFARFLRTSFYRAFPGDCFNMFPCYFLLKTPW